MSITGVPLPIHVIPVQMVDIYFSQPTKDSQLLKEVGHEGKGQISVVQQLLDEVKYH